MRRLLFALTLSAVLGPPATAQRVALPQLPKSLAVLPTGAAPLVAPTPLQESSSLRSLSLAVETPLPASLVPASPVVEPLAPPPATEQPIEKFHESASARFDGTKSAGQPSGLIWDEPPDAPGAPSAGLRILWWNIEGGKTNRRLGTNALNINLRSLAASPAAPDVLVLGEYKRSALDQDTHEALAGHYRGVFVPYNDMMPETGIMVFAKGEARVFPPRTMDWAPAELDERRKAAYRARWRERFPEAFEFTRRYIRLALGQEGAVINLVPVHLLQPWDALIQRHGRLGGAVAVAASLVFGIRNPLLHQVGELRARLEADFGAGLDREPLVLIGDFNLPRQLLGKVTRVYRLLSRGLRSAFAKTQATFPAFSSESRGKYPPLQIDHAFLSSGLAVEESGRLPLQGSDHYPIYVVVKPSNP